MYNSIIFPWISSTIICHNSSMTSTFYSLLVCSCSFNVCFTLQSGHRHSDAINNVEQVGKLQSAIFLESDPFVNVLDFECLDYSFSKFHRIITISTPGAPKTEKLEADNSEMCSTWKMRAWLNQWWNVTNFTQILYSLDSKAPLGFTELYTEFRLIVSLVRLQLSLALKVHFLAAAVIRRKSC